MSNLKDKITGTGRWALVMLVLLALGVVTAPGETCTTQSAMTPAERDALAVAARGMAEKVLSNDAVGLRSVTIDEYARDFSAIQNAVGSASEKVKGATMIVQQVYLLVASDLKRTADGAAA